MAIIGKMNTLRVVKNLNFGVFLDGEGLGNILLHRSEVPEGCKIDDFVDVFVHHDSKDRLIATTTKPKVMLGEFASLRVASVTPFGAFLDWGLSRNLLVHESEQKEKMQVGKSYVVFVYLEVDKKGKRLAASAKIDKFLDLHPHDFKEGQEVDLLICEQTELGHKAIVNNSHWGILYNSEVFEALKPGRRKKGFIKKIRDDQKIDLCLQKPGHQKISGIADTIITKLKEHGGTLAVTDKSDPKVIYEMFGVSKKNFKKSIGALYKRRLIKIEAHGITLSRKK